MVDNRRSVAGSRGDRSKDSDRFDELLADYLDRLNGGELLDPDEIVAEYPDIGERILAGLDAFIDLGVGDSRGDLGTVGDYTLRRQIGRGGMGVVYEAWQNSMDRRVALKVLPAGIAADSKAFIRFMREAKAAGKLQHQNIVGVYAIGVDRRRGTARAGRLTRRRVARVLEGPEDPCRAAIGGGRTSGRCSAGRGRGASVVRAMDAGRRSPSLQPG